MSPDFPKVINVRKLVTGDLLLVGGASFVRIFEGVEVWVGVKPAQEVHRIQGHM